MRRTSGGVRDLRGMRFHPRSRAARRAAEVTRLGKADAPAEYLGLRVVPDPDPVPPEPTPEDSARPMVAKRKTKRREQ